MTVGTMCTYAVAVYLTSVDGRTATVQLGCSQPLAGNYTCTRAAPSTQFPAPKRRSEERQLFLKELKIKMAVDARRKWLPRERSCQENWEEPTGTRTHCRPMREQCAHPSPRPSLSRRPEQHCPPWAPAGNDRGQGIDGNKKCFTSANGGGCVTALCLCVWGNELLGALF